MISFEENLVRITGWVPTVNGNDLDHIILDTKSDAVDYAVGLAEFFPEWKTAKIDAKWIDETEDAESFKQRLSEYVDLGDIGLGDGNG